MSFDDKPKALASWDYVVEHEDANGAKSYTLHGHTLKEAMCVLVKVGIDRYYFGSLVLYDDPPCVEMFTPIGPVITPLRFAGPMTLLTKPDGYDAP